MIAGEPGRRATVCTVPGVFNAGVASSGAMFSRLFAAVKPVALSVLPIILPPPSVVTMPKRSGPLVASVAVLLASMESVSRSGP